MKRLRLLIHVALVIGVTIPSIGSARSRRARLRASHFEYT